MTETSKLEKTEAELAELKEFLDHAAGWYKFPISWQRMLEEWRRTNGRL